MAQITTHCEGSEDGLNFSARKYFLVKVYALSLGLMLLHT